MKAIVGSICVAGSVLKIWMFLNFCSAVCACAAGTMLMRKMRMINRILNSLTLRLCAFAGENFPAKTQRELSNLHCMKWIRARNAHDEIERVNLSSLVAMKTDLAVELLNEVSSLRRREQLYLLPDTLNRQSSCFIAHDDL